MRARRAVVVLGLIALAVVAIFVARGCDDATIDAEAPTRANVGVPVSAVDGEPVATAEATRADRRRVELVEPRRVTRPATTYDTHLGVEASDARASREIRFRCVISDEQGHPIESALVSSQSARFAPLDGEVGNVRMGYSGDIGKGGFSVYQPDGVTSFGRAARSSADGSADVAVAREGRVTIFVWAVGYRPAVVHLGWVDLSRNDARIVLRRAPTGGRVRLVRDGVSIGACGVGVVTFDAGDAQDGMTLQTDVDGYMPTDWLERERAYWLSVKIPRSARAGTGSRLSVTGLATGVIVWDDRATLDIATDLTRPIPADVAAAWRASREQQRAQHPPREPPPLE